MSEFFEFDIIPSDDPDVREADQGFLVEVSWTVTAPEGGKSHGVKRVLVPSTADPVVELGALYEPSAIPAVSAQRIISGGTPAAQVYDVRLRHGTSAEWAAEDPVLSLGEEGIDTDTGVRKVGDGVTAWSLLPISNEGVTDHGALDGLGDDDHTQYALANGTRGAFAAPLGADDNYVTDAEKAALHTHPAVIAQGATQADARTAIGLGSAATTASTAYATAAQGATADGAAQKSANLSDLADAATARTNLGLNTAATVGALPIPDPGSFYPTDTITAALQLIGGREVYGTGSPEGVVTAAVGTYYTDTVGTVGAWRWQKKTGAGNTGWKVIHGDTGLRNVTALLKNGWTGQAYLRRVNDMVDIRLDSLNASAASSGIPLTLPSGFSLTNGLVHRSIFYTTAMTLRRASTVNDVTIVGYAAGDVLSSTLASITGDAWPTTLPGIAA